MQKSNYLILCAAICGLLCQPIYSQTRRVLGREEQMQREITRREAESERRLAELEALERHKNSIGKLPANGDNTPALDKVMLDRIRSFRQIDPAEQAKFSGFLSGPRTGMLRFFPDRDCVTVDYVRIDGECAAYVPNSYAFSFRANSYTNDYYHDIAFKQDQIVSTSFFSQGVVVSLGDVPIDKVDTTSAGLKYLIDFQPDLDPTKARKTAAKFAEGVVSNGFKYGRSVKTAENTTYAVRVVAYKIGNSLAPYSSTTTTMEKRFLSLSYDTRADVIVLFRIIKQEAAGPVTILWKELDRKDAPKIKFAKGEPLDDIKP
jgi:hypothetical protein